MLKYIKYFLFFVIFIISILIGKLLSKKYIERVKELKETKNALNIFKSKIKFTYEPIREVFDDISKTLSNNIGSIFKRAQTLMDNISAQEAWNKAIDESKNNLTKEDKSTLKMLSKLLGQTDIEGQINQINITNQFIEKQIEIAEKEREKNEKLYKKLIPTIALVVIVMLF